MNTKSLHSQLITIAVILLSAAALFGQDQGDQEKAKLISVPKVAIPEAAKEAGVGGDVRALVTVDETGKVTSVKGVFGPGSVCPQVTTPAVTELRTSAKEAALSATFHPATRKGKAVKTEVFLTFNFGESKDLSNRGPDRATLKDAGNEKDLSGEGPAPSGKPKVISGGVLNGAAISLPKPDYPPAARAVRASGAVTIKVLVDHDGLVYSAEPASGHPLLRSSARDSACGAKFRPTLLQGEPVKVSGFITYNFVP